VQVRFMQLVDYYVGIPATLLLSGVRMITDLFRRAPFASPRRILFVELSEMGSAIIAYSALKRAVTLVGRENVYFLIFGKNRESVDILGLVPPENVITINEASLPSFLFSLPGALWRLWRQRIDTVLDLELFSRCTAMLSFLCGARVRAGFHNYTEEGLFRGTLFTHRVLYNEHHHMAENFLALLRSVERPPEVPAVKEDMRPYLVPLPDASLRKEIQNTIDNRLSELIPNLLPTDKLVVLNPDPGLLALRGWPVRSFAELAGKLVQDDPHVKIVIMGLARSGLLAREVLLGIPAERAADMSGRTANVE